MTLKDFKLPGGSIKLEAVKGRECTKKRAATCEKDSVIVDIEQVDMAGPVYSEKNIVGQCQNHQHD